MLLQMYGKETFCRLRTFERFSCFRDGRDCVEEDAHTGRPYSVLALQTIEKAFELVISDRRVQFEYS
ncbi:hypothetical protein X975_09561, partial [Stegodyphus mimosarum]